MLVKCQVKPLNQGVDEESSADQEPPLKKAKTEPSASSSASASADGDTSGAAVGEAAEAADEQVGELAGDAGKAEESHQRGKSRTPGEHLRPCSAEM